jgi:glycosyltransferase involved in cell wall biosynthesis
MMDTDIELSIIVIVYRMRRQAYNTLYSLSTAYQRNTTANYEVVVVENSSDENLAPEEIESLPGNFRYFLREEAGVSPVPAVNFALQQCRGTMIGLLIDGARMLSPRVLEHVMTMRRAFAHPLIVVPGYHLGAERHDAAGPTRAIAEQEELERLGWRSDGYRLFTQACFSPGNARGYFHPLMECNALFCNRQSFIDLHGADPRFDLAGGGSINLHIYRSLGMQPGNQLVVLPGEGNFHQYHGGVTTRAVDDRSATLAAFKNQLDGFWGGQYKALSREPLLFGNIGSSAQRFLQLSCSAGMARFERLAAEGKPAWPDDETCLQQRTTGNGH